jgi:hypothetical protein
VLNRIVIANLHATSHIQNRCKIFKPNIMKLADIPYFVKFIFSCENCDDCFSTTDSEMMKYVINESTGKPVIGLKIGQVLQFEPIDENLKKYKIQDIIIRHLFDDTDGLKYGFDSQDCVSSQGEPKEWLFSILIKLELQ